MVYGQENNFLIYFLISLYKTNTKQKTIYNLMKITFFYWYYKDFFKIKWRELKSIYKFKWILYKSNSFTVEKSTICYQIGVFIVIFNKIEQRQSFVDKILVKQLKSFSYTDIAAFKLKRGVFLV